MAESKDCYFITEPFTFEDEDTGAEYMAMPNDRLEITTMVDFNSKTLGQQFASLECLDDYITQIAPCRTFVFIHELQKLIGENLIKGGDLDNAIVIVDRILSQEELDDIAVKLHKPSVKVALSPFAKAPMVHVIAVVPAQLPFVVARETNVVPAGMVSVNTTPVASSGPLFDTTIV